MESMTRVGYDIYSLNEMNIDARMTISSYEECNELGVMRLNTTDGNFTYQIKQRGLGWIVFVSIYYPITMAAFYSYRKHYAMLRNRSFLLLFIQTIGQLFNIR